MLQSINTSTFEPSLQNQISLIAVWSSGPLWSLLLWERLHLPWDRIPSDRLFHWIDSFLLLLSQKLVVNHFDKVRVRVYNYDDESRSHLNGTFQWVVVEVGTSQGGSHREDPYLWMRATLLTWMLTSQLTIRVLTLHWRAVLLIIYPWICKCIILYCVLTKFGFFQKKKKINKTLRSPFQYIITLCIMANDDRNLVYQVIWEKSWADFKERQFTEKVDLFGVYHVISDWVLL